LPGPQVVYSVRSARYWPGPLEEQALRSAARVGFAEYLALADHGRRLVQRVARTVHLAALGAEVEAQARTFQDVGPDFHVDAAVGRELPGRLLVAQPVGVRRESAPAQPGIAFGLDVVFLPPLQPVGIDEERYLLLGRRRNEDEGGLGLELQSLLRVGGR
jgi:hypothetical protein